MVMFEILEYTPSRVVNINVGDSILGVFLQEIRLYFVYLCVKTTIFEAK